MLEEVISELEHSDGGSQWLNSRVTYAIGYAPDDTWTLETHGPNTYNMSAGCWTKGNRIRTPLPYTTSLDQAYQFLNDEVKSIKLTTLYDEDGMACSASIWVYPNGLSGEGAFLVKGMSHDLPTALTIAVLKIKLESEKINE